VNRQEKRALQQSGVRVVVATATCERCGAPMCPECGGESMQCVCCGEFNCETCGVYVLAAVAAS
jgi:hypothetical protein